MINENKIEIIKKLSYYCQSTYTSIHLFNEMVENRKIQVVNELLIKIIDDMATLMKFYSQLNSDTSMIDNINSKLELVLEGYANMDYYYIKDVFEYEILPIVQNIFNEIKYIISNENSGGK